MIPTLSTWSRRELIAAAAMLTLLLVSLVYYMHTAYGHGDISLYHRYAQAFWLGSPPLHSLPAEYPLLSVAAFTLTLLPPLPDFVTVYGLWMLLLFAVGYLAMRRRESPRVAEICGIYLAVGCFGTVLGRFDLLPAATTVVAYWAARQRRFTLAYAMVALGTLLKLYPLFLLPIVVLEHYRVLELNPLRSRPPAAVVRGVALFAGAVAASFALAALLAPGQWLSTFTYNIGRPLQVESVGASLLWLSGLAGFPTAPVHSFHSFNLVGRLDGLVGAAADLALVGGCLWTYWRQLRGRIAFGAAMALCLLVIVCTDRVFSPQYLMWLIPLVAIVEARYDPVWLAICLLTTLVFPVAYQAFGLRGSGAPASYPLVFMLLIGVRNALLLLATTRLALRPRSLPAAARQLEPTRTTAA